MIINDILTNIADRIKAENPTFWDSFCVGALQVENGKVLIWDGNEAKDAGLTDNRGNVFYIRYEPTIPVSEGERITSCANAQLNIGCTLVAHWKDTDYKSVLGTLIAGIVKEGRTTASSILIDYEQIYKQETRKDSVKRLKGWQAISISFQVNQSLIVDCRIDLCDVPQSKVCADGTVRIEYENGTLIEIVIVGSGQEITATVPNPGTCPNGTGRAVNSLNTVLATGSVPSGGTANITVPDISFTDSNGNVSSVPAGVNVVATPCPPPPVCDPATYTLENTDGTLLDSGSIASGGSDVIIAPDGDVEINGTPVGSVVSGGVIDLPVIQDGNPVGSWNGTQWVVPACPPTPTLSEALTAATACEINAAMPELKRDAIFPNLKLLHFNPTNVPSINSNDYKNNLTGNEVPFFTLPCNNFVGLSSVDAALAGITLSTTRFTNTLGGTVFDGSDGSVASVVLDHLQKEHDGTRNCLMILLTVSTTGRTFANALNDADALVAAGFSNWRLPDFEETLRLMYFDSSVGSLQHFRYSPFNHFGIATNQIFWTRERAGILPDQRAWVLNDGIGGIQPGLMTNATNIYFAIRKHTF